MARPAAPRGAWMRALRAGAVPLRWMVPALLAAGLALAPLANLVALAWGGGIGIWPHLLRYVLPPALANTALLLVGVGVVVIVIGTATAWLVTACRFPGRDLFAWALLLPLAIPTYIVAFVYVDLLHPIGPVQGLLRALLGIARPADLRLPDIRSLTGAAILLGLVLYPYVFLTTRALFLMQSGSLAEVARTLGVGPWGLLFRVALPLARPAVAVGAALALMEVLNDVGASAFLGVETLTLAIYATWTNQSDLAGAAQIALVLVAVVVGLVALERHGRRRQRYALAGQRARPLAPVQLRGGRAALAVVACALPVLLGFVVPAVHLAVESWRRIVFAGWPVSVMNEAMTTVALSACATVLAVLLGLMVAYGQRLAAGGGVASLGRLGLIGYAMPGTVLALGLLPVLGIVTTFAADLGLGLAAGATLLLVTAYVVRFLAIASGNVETGFARLSPSLDHVARTLGHGPGATLRRVCLPLAIPSVAAATMLVFVDCMKELPLTLMLRPLNVETLATHLYGEAIRGTYEDGAIAALIIVAVGLGPVVLLSRIARRAGLAGMGGADA